MSPAAATLSILRYWRTASRLWALASKSPLKSSASSVSILAAAARRRSKEGVRKGKSSSSPAKRAKYARLVMKLVFWIRAMARSCSAAEQRKLRQPSAAKKPSTSARWPSSAPRPATTATGSSAPGGDLGPKSGCVPTTGPGQSRSIWRRGRSLTEVMSASTAPGASSPVTRSATSSNTAAGTQSRARSAPASAALSASFVSG